MPREPRYMDQKYMEPNRSQLLNWSRKADKRELSEYGGGRYLEYSGSPVRNPHIRPLLHRGRKP